MLSILAHVKWFTTDVPIEQPSLRLSEWIIVALSVGAGLFVLRWIDAWLDSKKYTKRLDVMLKTVRPLVPLIVRLSTTLLLAVNIWQGYLLAPNIEADTGQLSNIVFILFTVAAVLIGAGYYMRVGVAFFAVAYLLTFSYVENIVDALDHLEYLAIAGYLWLRGPGPHSIDNWITGRHVKNSGYRAYSLTVYRVGVGVGLIVLGLSEKLLNITVAQDFLTQYGWNFMAFAGVSDRLFIIAAGAVELLVGFALILNYAPRLLVTTLLLLMSVTALLLGIEEVYGHLFAVGIVAAIWVNDTEPARTN